VRRLADQALDQLNPASAGFTRRAAGPRDPPEQLLLALLLQATYSIRVERMLVEQQLRSPGSWCC